MLPAPPLSLLTWDRFYANEKEVGEAVGQSGLKRSDVFIATKVLSSARSADKTYESLLKSVHKIDGENGYVDLTLIHTAIGVSKARKYMYLALDKLLEDGRRGVLGLHLPSRNFKGRLVIE